MARRIWGGSGSANFGDIEKPTFDDWESICDFAETIRSVAGNAADALGAGLDDFYLALLNTSALGGRTPAGIYRARRLVSPLRWSAKHSLPAIQRRASQMPPRFQDIYDEILHPKKTSGSGKGLNL